MTYQRAFGALVTFEVGTVAPSDTIIVIIVSSCEKTATQTLHDQDGCPGCFSKPGIA
jgi:hypothetical protein